MLTPETPWSGLDPHTLAAELHSTKATWWVCGGWAIDLFLGEQSRHHVDLDIGCFRTDVSWFQNLPNWIGLSAHEGTLRRVAADATLPSHIHSMWFARVGATTWDFQLMVETRLGSHWLFRRDASIKRRVEDLWWTTDDGLQVIRPEIQLLYKAHGPRPHDEMDFRRVLPTMNAVDREWLRGALERLYPGHAWTVSIEGERAT